MVPIPCHIFGCLRDIKVSFVHQPSYILQQAVVCTYPSQKHTLKAAVASFVGIDQLPVRICQVNDRTLSGARECIRPCSIHSLAPFLCSACGFQTYSTCARFHVWHVSQADTLVRQAISLIRGILGFAGNSMHSNALLSELIWTKSNNCSYFSNCG